MKKAVVIGGSGFMGNSLASMLEQRGYAVDTVDKRQGTNSRLVTRLVTRLADIGKLSEYELIELVDGAEAVYCMGGLLGTSELRKTIAAAVRENVLNTCRLIEACVVARVPHFFYPSKPKVWPDVYTVTKCVNEELAAVYNEYHPIKVTCLKCFSSYGPGQSIYPVRKMLPVFIALALRGKPISVYGDGSQVVDLMYVDDMSDNIIRATEAGVTQVCDLGSGRVITVAQVAEIINDMTGNAAGLTHLPMRPGETTRVDDVANLLPLHMLMDVQVPTSIFTGLENTVRYYHARSEEVDEALRFYGI